MDDSRRVEELTASIQQPAVGHPRRIRALHPWGEDKNLPAAIYHGEFLMHGFRNRDLRPMLHCDEPASEPESRRRTSLQQINRLQAAA